MIELGELQRTHGHTVEFFAMADEENLPATYEDDFAPAMSLKPFPTKPTEQVVTLGNMIWSRRAKQSFERVLDQFQPDVVHLHNIYHQLSPSILRPPRIASLSMICYCCRVRRQPVAATARG